MSNKDYLITGEQNHGVGLKDSPNPKQYSVVPPDMEYVYFEHASAYPLYPRERSFCLVNAWWMAECAYLAYTHPGFARMAYRLAGFPGFRFFSEKGTECMVAWNTECVIVSFRGTELRSISAIREISADLDAAPVPFPSGGNVHRGFLRALHNIWDELSPFLAELKAARSDRPMMITGHSLGGALATLAFTLTAEADSLYIYGSPRVGDRGFTNLTAERPVWRIENSRDPIVLLPPDVPRINVEYLPVGQLAYLDREGSLLSQRPTLDSDALRKKAKKTIWKQLVGFLMIFRRLKKRLFRQRIDAKKVIAEIGDHLHSSAEEWKSHFEEVERQTGLRVDDHMPVYYAVKLWNNVISDDQKRGPG